jgi:protein-S-isoprenylcysteine O-methyltransferase Ste14
MDKLELRLPPALVFVFFASAMFLLARFLPVGRFDFTGRTALMWGLLGLGLLTGALAVAQVVRAGNSLSPHHPERTKALVESGIYDLSRNPMYLALLMVLLSWGLYLGNAFNTLLAALFVAYMNRFQIGPEERVLEQKFGPAYRQYCKLVRRWF